MQTHNTRQSGFTLVELAIVLMIMGLLIGGILRGQELLNNARITGLIQQVKAYQGTTVTFRDTYSAMPGDISNATRRLPNCNAANFCGNGDGNGIVGLTSGNTFSVRQSANQAVPQIETSYFWKHLAMARLISGVNPAADIMEAEWGQTHPDTKLGGGFTIFYSTIATDVGIGHSLKFQQAVLGSSVGNASVLVVSPVNARIIDEKMDDGHPDRGNVQSDSSGSGCDPGGRYAVTDQIVCVMFFKID